jgi:hypothetical protein
MSVFIPKIVLGLFMVLMIASCTDSLPGGTGDNMDNKALN